MSIAALNNQLRNAASRARWQAGECPHRAGDDSETSYLRERWYAALGREIGKARAEILRDARRVLSRGTRDFSRRGNGNRAARRIHELQRDTYCPFDAAREVLRDFVS